MTTGTVCAEEEATDGARGGISRAMFAELGRSRRRGRQGPVRVTYVPTGSDDVQVAYAISTKVGGAVVRNRIRRRLRAAVAALAESMPGGAYLYSVDKEAGCLGWQELCRCVKTASVRAYGDAGMEAGR